jgi:hypothetical protein
MLHKVQSYPLSRPFRCAKGGLNRVKPNTVHLGLNQNTATIDNDHGACAETFTHQVKIGLGKIICFSDSTNGQHLPDLLKERISLRFRHVSPQLFE